jgi:hypothetical protein
MDPCLFFQILYKGSQKRKLLAMRSLGEQPEVVSAFWQSVRDPFVAINAGLLAGEQKRLMRVCGALALFGYIH